MDTSPPGGSPAIDPPILSQTGHLTGGVIGHVDHIARDRMSGWAFDPLRPDERIVLEILHEEQPICTFEADIFRDDLLEAGIGDGRHGFSLTLPMELFAAPVVILRVYAIRDGTELVGSPVRVRNHTSMIDEETLGTLSQVIHQTVRSAQTSDDLHGLTSWLIEHFDVVYQRQAALAESTHARRRQFSNLIGNNTQLSDILRQASEAVVAKFAALTLADVERPKVSVIIPVFGHFDYTYRCLASIIEHLPEASIEVLVIDDASTDETIYAALVLSGGIRLIRNRHNVGFAPSSTNGARAARGEYLLFLNNDTEVRPGWLDELVGTLERDPSIGVVGSKLLYPDGRLQEVGGIIWRQASGWNWGRQLDANDPRFCFMRDADYVSGASLMIRRALFDEVGGFSPEFSPAYYEDTDLCFKVRQSGRRVVVQPASQIVHHEGVSAGVDVAAPGMKRFQRINQRVFLEKWFDVLQTHYLSESDARRASERLVQKRVLFIDDTVPTPDCDAGSNAALQHMKSLQRIGYKVNFVGADNMAKISPYTEALERAGIQNYYAPYFWSVEEIFRREIFRFDLFYIHRMMNVIKYAPMIRQRFPGVRIIFNVADLHHVRLAREATVTGNSTIAEAARAAKETELAAIAEADAVIVHSTYERELLSRIAPAADVHVIPWAVRSTPTSEPFKTRSGIAFVGGYNHTPNVDAALWLVREVLPLVHARDPSIECSLIGSHMPEAIRQLERPGVRILGHVPELVAVLRHMRLTVAPIRYGAGLKGKVLTSLAAGLPCVATPCALEGMGLPSTMDAMSASSAVDFAGQILRLHSDEAHNARMAAEGCKFIEERCAENTIDALMANAVAVAGRTDDQPVDSTPQVASLKGQAGQRRQKLAADSKQIRGRVNGEKSL